MRLIDVDAFKAYWNKEYRMLYPNDKYLVALSNFPTIDPENLRPKGEWKLLHTGEIVEFVWECSNCKHKIGVPFKFCPNCGAYMRGE